MKSYNDYYEFKKWCFQVIGDICKLCGSSENLEIDHINRETKSFTVTKEWASKTENEILKELTKCQSLCKKCHKEKSNKELSEANTKPINHGTMYAWSIKKCECEICFQAKQKWQKERNNRRRQESLKSYDLSKKHGATKYKRGCRCEVCKAGHAKKAREYRQAKSWKFESS